MTQQSFLPQDFIWGFATASAQIEGGSEAEERASRGVSIWDKFCEIPGNIEDGTSTFRTTDHFARWKEDVALMKSLGVQSYRFSLSWPRIVPGGSKGGEVNAEGVEFYSELIDELLRNDILPFVTLFHWDLPNELQDSYGGWVSPKVIEDFLYYANICFSQFGDRIKHWLTFNEPYCIAWSGYGNGHFAPGIRSETELWKAGHQVILAHAHASSLYRSQYQSSQGGTIGITLSGDWTEPFDNSPENVSAAQRKRDFVIGWFADPIYLGQYPKTMIDLLGDRLPRFTQEEVGLLKGSSEFYGCNAYTTTIIRAADDIINGNTVAGFTKADGSEIGLTSSLDWLRCVPWGMRKLLVYLWDRYKLPIYMTENGFSIDGESQRGVNEAVHDTARVQYFEGYLEAIRQAIVEDRVIVKSYFAWSFLDNFEWNSGLTTRFGVVHTDFETFERTSKDSAKFVCDWFKRHISKA